MILSDSKPPIGKQVLILVQASTASYMGAFWRLPVPGRKCWIKATRTDNYDPSTKNYAVRLDNGEQLTGNWQWKEANQ